MDDSVQKTGVETDTKRQEWIEKRINEARNKVFNNMPIRLLTFDQDGGGITLVGRLTSH